MNQEISTVVGERDEPNTIWMKFDKPLVINVILGGAHDIVKVKE